MSAERPDRVIIRRKDNRPWGTLKNASAIDELTGTLSSEFLILKQGGLNRLAMLLPTAGGPDSDLSAEVARTLHRNFGADISVMHAVDGPGEREAGERFLEGWAADRDHEEAELLVDESGDIEGAIERAARQRSLVLVGATEWGLLSWLVSNSLHLDVINQVNCCVLLAEKPHKRPLRQRLFG